MSRAQLELAAVWVACVVFIAIFWVGACVIMWKLAGWIV